MKNELRFRDMTEAEYAAYYDWTTRHYAECMIKSGGQTDKDAALKFAKDDLAECLTNGINTAGTFFYTVENGENEDIGLLVWQEDIHEKGVAFILDIMIYEDFRRRGYATRAVKMLFDVAKERGYKKCRLNVFNFNTGAKSVYEKCGMSVEKEFRRTTLMIIDL